MKKIIAVLLALFILICISACGNNETTDTQKTETAAETSQHTSEDDAAELTFPFGESELELPEVPFEPDEEFED